MRRRREEQGGAGRRMAPYDEATVKWHHMTWQAVSARPYVLGLRDPPRPEVRGAIEDCKTAVGRCRFTRG